MERLKIKKKLIVFGDGGHSKVVLNELNLSIYDIVGNVIDKEDNFLINKNKKKIPLSKLLKKNFFAFVAIADNTIRAKIFNKFKKYKNLKWISIISKNSFIQKNVKIGKGTVVMPGSIINNGAKIGDNCIINSSCVVEHNCAIGNNSNLCPGVIIGGNTSLVKNCFIGMSASVSNNLIIQENTIIGAKSFMNRNSKKNLRYYGIPAKPIS
jgi:sugar O-acyltransferase (sialic acid O-acetyltransferase NeuD family)